MVSPPKPWERAGSVSSLQPSSSPSLPATPPASNTSPSTTAQHPPASSATSAVPPTVPDRPSALSSPSALPTSPFNRFGASSYGGYGGYGGLGSYSGMGGMGGYNSFNSYSGIGGYGGYGSMGYGGGYGSMFGSGGMMNGLPGYGMNPMGGPGGPLQLDAQGNPVSLTQTLESTTHHTFALLHSIVQTFAGVAHMLENTFMATHSSFFAMVGVVDQFTQLRNAIGSVLGLFGLLRWLKESITGRPSGGAMGSEFQDFVNGRPVLPLNGGTPQGPKPSRKPLIIFLLAIFGIPYAMHKLIKLLAAHHPAHQLRIQNAALPPLEASQLQFAHAIYPFQASNQNELTLKENDLVAIVAKIDPRTGMEVDPRIVLSDEGADAEWWKGRMKDGKEGWFPRKWVQILEPREPKREPKKLE